MDNLSLSKLICKIESVADKYDIKRPPKSGPAPKLSWPQIVAVCIARSWFKVTCWKDFFCNPLILAGWRSVGGFELGSYGRFILRLPEVRPLLNQVLMDSLEPWTGFGAVDSAMIPMGLATGRCASNFKALRRTGASVGHGSYGVCFGGKLSLVVTDTGKLNKCELSSAGTHDLAPVKAGLLDHAIGIVLADRGYISRVVAAKLKEKSVSLWARPKASSWQQFDEIQLALYRYREIIEGVISKLKYRFTIVPRWPPRRWTTALATIFGALIAYTLCPNTPNMKWRQALRAGP
jgi:hypothetical protein